MKSSALFLSMLMLTSLVSAETFAQSRRDDAEKRLMVEDAYEAPAGQLFNEEAYLAGETAFNDYTNVIVINKAANKQTLRLYTNRQLMLTTDVSTGVENLEYVGAVKNLIRALPFVKGTRTSHWRHTTRGFYTVKRIENKDYYSRESGFHMPYAMFFNDIRGLAVHQVPPDLSGGERAGEAALGSRASSGCVRVHKNVIQQIHTAVTLADKGQVPVIDTKTGQAKLDSQGRVQTSVAFKTLVIVEEY